MDVDTEINRLEERLASYREQIDELEGETDAATGTPKEALQAELADVRKHFTSAEEHLAELRLRKAEAWQDETFRTALLNVFDVTGDRIDRSFRRKR
jgi:predicted  nucleic acid-binding Zn-ribbon protein